MKRIVLLSDGTGNSSAKLFKTNVWRTYQSLDLETAHHGIRQIACYSDGVGTSAFRPLAILGGVFGYGLKRNILHLYDFLCRTWEPGDEIWLFGFSRGAFTVRVLAGMIASEGVLSGASETELAYATRDIYRAYRKKRSTLDSAIPDPLLVKPFRAIRDAFIGGWRRLWRQKVVTAADLTDVGHIGFIGVWDTVAAYGSPFAELTFAIDRTLFRLSMPDHELNAKVRVARQALALDDERDTFHPLLWNECEAARPERIRQVWFAGMHSDVGGGYPDDALSVRPLIWMLDEASEAGLALLPGAMERFAPPPTHCSVLHDSRRGVAGYYRYQPRRLSAFLLPQDPETLLMVDPRRRERAHVPEVLLHHSVLERIGDPGSGYAPIGLPGPFRVVDPNGAVVDSPETPDERHARVAGQPSVWDMVWHKRMNYSLIVMASGLLVLMPVLGEGAATSGCERIVCGVSPLFQVLEFVLPGAVGPWLAAFSANPGKTLLLVGVLWALLARSAWLQTALHDRMRRLWAPRWGQAVPAETFPVNWCRPLRTAGRALSFTAFMKWRVWPLVLGVGLVLVLVAGSGLGVGIPAARGWIAHGEGNGVLCDGKAINQAQDFATDMSCWDTRTDVEAGRTYRVEIEVEAAWADETIAASPLGYDANSLPHLIGYVFAPIKRSINGRWFQPHVTIIGPDHEPIVQPLEFVEEGLVFVASLKPEGRGRAYLWVNDAIVPFFGPTKYFYDNNYGTARVRFAEFPEDAPPRPAR